MFAKTFVMNLAFKTDRLSKFRSTLPACFGEVIVWPAVHGDSVQHPDWWTAGRGAWGCYRSHFQILEHCYQQNLESYLVFEDDAMFREGCQELFADFMAEVPEDWEQLYLGGQLLHEIAHPPQRVTNNVYIPFNVNRTHCFAVHRRGYEKIYKHLNAVPFHNAEHIDHHTGRLHESGKLRVYCPGKWIVGQDGGPSNISGRENSAMFWVDPEKLLRKDWMQETMTCVFLESTIGVAIDLEQRGWHRGHWKNAQHLDNGIVNAMAESDCKPGLKRWHGDVVPEAVRQGSRCVCLYHPELSWDCVQSLGFKDLIRITANNAVDAERQLTQHQSVKTPEESSSQASPIKNLIYHIWPKQGNGTWQWNVSQLLSRIEQFDGVRTVGIVTDGQSDTVEVVQSAFAGTRIDNWISFHNNPELGEVVTFGKMLETLPRDEHSVTFYGHAKGVSYDEPTKTRDWTEMLYEICLDDAEYVEAALRAKPVAGPFTVDNRWPGGNKHGWYFSGSFYWFRNKDAFSRAEAAAIRQDRWGAELWPGEHFELKETGILFGQGCGHLYESQELERMKAWMAEWKRGRRKTPPLEPRVSVIVPTLGRTSLISVVTELVKQLSPLDELIVVADGLQALNQAAHQCAVHGDRIQFSSYVDEKSCYGNAQRNHGMDIAQGDVLWCVDDDDTVLPGAIATIKKTLSNSMKPTMFKMSHLRRIIPEGHDIDASNVGGPMLVVPNRPDLPRFPVPAIDPRLSDLEWINAVKNWNPDIKFSNGVIYAVTAEGLGQ